jgi:hypothetical protein
MRLLDFVKELAAGAALLLFVPMAVLVVGTPIVLVVRLIVSLIERL